MTRHTEASQQRLLVKRIRLDARTRDLVIASFPNGYLTSKRQAAFAKAEGLTAGMPDLVVFEARAVTNTVTGVRYGILRYALMIELKSATGTLSAAQKAIHQKLTDAGYCVRVVRSAEEGWRVLCEYLGIAP